MISHGLTYWCHCAVLPGEVRQLMLKLLHEAHQGISTVKALAHSLFCVLVPSTGY